MTKTAVSEHEAVGKLIAAFEAAWNEHDADAMAALLTEDAEWVNTVGWWWRGKPSVRMGWEWIHRGVFSKTEWHANSVSIRFITTDTTIASITGTTGSYTLPNGTIVPGKRDRLSVFLVKRDGRWLIASGQNTEINLEAEKLNPVGVE
jgi:uncharacterized protein (TIGR02246 family)